MTAIFLNELHYDNVGTDTGEGFEIAGPAGTSLTGWTVVLYNGTGGAPYATIALSGSIPDAGAGFGTVSVTLATNGMQNGAPDGIALVDATGAVVQFLSYEGSLTAVGGPADGMTSTDIGVAESAGDPAGLSLQLTGTGRVSTDFTWVRGAEASFGAINAGQVFAEGSATAELTRISAIQGTAATQGANPVGAFDNADASPLKGQVVTIEAIVTGDFQNGDADAGRSLGGFYLQEEDADSDGDAASSEGIFVADAGFGADVQPGDRVRVTGTVQEYFGQTRIGAVSAVTVVSSGNDLPSTAAITLGGGVSRDQSGGWQANLEAFEGMLVTLPATLTITEQYQLDRFNEIVLFDTNGFEQAGPAGTTLVGERPFQFTQFNDPDAAGNEAWARQVGARQIVYDDGLNAQNQPVSTLDGFQDYGSDTAPSMGDTVTGLTGVLDYQWAGASASGSTWRIRATEDGQNSFDDTNARPAAEVALDGAIKVASFNVLNFFTTLDTYGVNEGVGPGADQEPRGADTDPQGAAGTPSATEEYDRQLDKLVSALLGLRADIVGLTELENDFRADGAAPAEAGAQGDRGVAVAALVAALNAVEGAGTWASVDPGAEFVGGDAIAVGLIYRTDAVQIAPGTSVAVLTDDAISADLLAQSTVGGIFNGASTSRAPLAATFETLDGGDRMTVVVNHLKSKGGTGTGADADAGDGAGAFDNQRLLAAQALDAWLKTDPTGDATDNRLLIGDFNAYAEEAPIDWLTDEAGFVNVVAEFVEAGYSYLFDAMLGTLDYAFASVSLFNAIVDALEWNINSDEADALDYNLEFGRDPAIFDGSEPYRASDHDPLVVGITFAEDDVPLQVTTYEGRGWEGPIEASGALTVAHLASLNLAGAEIAAYAGYRLYVTSNAGLQILDITDPSAPTLTAVVDFTTLGFAGTDITSAATNGTVVAVALPAADKTAPGTVVVLDLDGRLVASYTVGALPDMLTFTPDGTRILVANEGEPSDGFAVNPKGAVSVIDLAAHSVTTLDFTAFDGQENALRAAGVRIFEGQSVSDDLEPEYIAVSKDGTRALVTLQEANAVAILDLGTLTFTDIVPLGGKDFASLLADFSDKDGTALKAGAPVIGQFMPDAIASYVGADGHSYYVIANEGDDRDDFLPTDETARLSTLDLDDATFPGETALKKNAAIGRLTVSDAPLLNGDTDGDGDIDQILTYGARSFSILDADGRMVFDSGDAIERILAAQFPELWDDSRADNKGAEPEGVTVSVIDGRAYAFLGLERSNATLVFDVTDPAEVSFVTLARHAGDLAPEGTLVIPAEVSPTGEAIYVASNEGSGTLALYSVEAAPKVFTLDLLHMSDQEGTGTSVVHAPNASAVMNALEAQDLGGDGIADHTIRLSSGDAIIPGVFYDASAAVFGSGGIADIQIQNELGFQAIAFGNHEFDKGTAALAGLISGAAPGGFAALSGTALDGQDFGGTDMPYLSANLDFSTDPKLAGLAVAGGQAPVGRAVTSSTVIEEGGELIGVVGATTPTLARISSPGSVGIAPVWAGTLPTEAELDALAAVIQTEVDALLAANPTLNKVVLLAHMQQLSIEQALAPRLHGVDIIMAGGSNTRLADGTDRLIDGDVAQGPYPIFTEDADGHTTVIVNTDGNYKYVGRLVIDFDEDGHVIADSYDAAVSGIYATDEAGVAALGAGDMVDPEIAAIADAIEAQIVATQSNVFGISKVFLNGNRTGTETAGNLDGVRSQETNLGDLTADANLAYARQFDATVAVSIKNGGGIRASIGETVVPAGGDSYVRQANGAILDGEGQVIKPEGGISEADIKAALAFNNTLSLVTVTRAELVAILEHAAANVGGGAFAQVSGLQFSFDPARPAGDRIVSAAITDAEGRDLDVLVRDGALVGDAAATVRVVTLDFMAGGGDGYPFPTGAAANRVSLTDLDANGAADAAFDGVATFAANGTEQDAFAEYLAANFATPGTAFDMADAARDGDGRIQNLAWGTDSVIDAPVLNPVTGTAGRDRLVGTEGADLIVSGAGNYDTMQGLAGADIFVFGAEALDRVRERDTILDYEVGVDAIALAEGVSVASIRQSGSSVLVYLENGFGANDAVYIQGPGVSVDTITFIDTYGLLSA